MKQLYTGLTVALFACGIGAGPVEARQPAGPGPTAPATTAPFPTAPSSAAPTAMATSAAPAPAASAAPAAPAAPLGPAAPAAPAVPPADFGTPPSGQIPILFNDRHVYTKPDRLRAGRVLAALVRGNAILIPLRSMFEQMGATVSYDPASRTATVSKPGSEVKVTVGRPEVLINGESRPLDVPPEVYQGSVVVPVRVISEGMGAYVQWVPDRRIVVVRYIQAAPPTPVPTAPPTVAPTPPPTPAPTPPPKPPRYYEHFIVGDYIFNPHVYNAFSPPSKTITGASYAGRVGVEFPLIGIPWMLEADARQYQYLHTGHFDTTVPRNAPCPVPGESGCVTPIGGTPIGGIGSVYVPSFTALDRDIDGRLGIQVVKPRIYFGVGWLWRNNNYGYPQQNGFGFGLEKLPDLDQPISGFGSYWYFPNVYGKFTDPTSGFNFTVRNRIQKYNVGFAIRLLRFSQTAGMWFEGAFIGDFGTNIENNPANFKHYGGAAGLGFHF